jgi:hypothetical protein
MKVYQSTFYSAFLYPITSKFGWMGLFMLLLVTSPLIAQQKKPSSPNIMLKDPVDLGDTVRTGLLNKMVQPLRLKENRIARERKQIVDMLRSLTNRGDLYWDETKIDSIVSQLIVISSNLDDTQESTNILKNQLDEVFGKVASKAPLVLVDSIKLQLGNLLQQFMNENSALEAAARKELLAKLVSLKQVQHACGSMYSPQLEAVIGDSVCVIYQKCIQPKTRVFGWHSLQMDKQIKNYNFNYLTDIILDGYELGSNGLETNSNSLASLLNSGIISKSRSFGKSVTLAIKINSATELEKFLRQRQSQEVFFGRLKELRKQYGLSGVTIYFEALQPQQARLFAQFIANIRSQYINDLAGFDLHVSLPSLANTANSALASSLDYAMMNKDVNFYILRTDQLNITNTRIPFSRSPLYKDPANTRGSIEQTLAYFSNGKIELKKLVMTVSYQGMTWPVPNFFPGTRALEFGKEISYKVIQEEIVGPFANDDYSFFGHDPEQASALINYDDYGILRQVWYEDARSLAEKYMWVLDNQLGGVAIRGLGLDDGHTELWDVLGASLMQVDSVVLGTDKVLKKSSKGTRTLRQYLRTYFDDLQWAGLNDIYLGSPDITNPHYCYFKPYPRGDSLVMEAKRRNIQLTSYWDHTIPFQLYPGSQEYGIYSMEECICLLGRWERYTEINGLSTLILLLLLAITITVIFIGIKNEGDDWRWRNGLTIFAIVVGLLFFLNFTLFLFFNTQIGFLGAGSNEVTLRVVFLIFLTGLAVGYLIHVILIKRKYSLKDLP